MSDAKDRDERLADWVDGRMSARDRERFEAELRVNPTLRRRAEEYQRTVESVQRVLRAPATKIDIADAVMRQIAESGAKPAPLPRTAVVRTASRRALLQSCAVAAVVFVLVALLVRWRPEPESTTVAERTVGARPGTGRATGEVLNDSEERLHRDTAMAAADTPAAPAPDAGADREGERLADDAKVQQQPAPPRAKDRDEAQLFQEVGSATKANPPVVPTDAAPRPPTEAMKERGRTSPGADAPFFVGATAAVPTTMLPQVRLQRSADVARAVPQGQSQVEAAATAFFLRADTDLTAVLPSGSLQIQRLARAPAAPGVAAGFVAEEAGKEPLAQAWLVEGSGTEVYHYLAMLSGAGRSLGFDLVNGEVATNEVLTLLPAAAPTAQSTGGVSDAARDDLAETLKAEVKDKAGNVEPAPTELAEQKADAGESREQRTAKGESTTRPRGAPRSAPALGNAHAPTAGGGGPGSPGPAGPPAGVATTSPQVEAVRRLQTGTEGLPFLPSLPDPSALLPRVRVVIVIDRAPAEKR